MDRPFLPFKPAGCLRETIFPCGFPVAFAIPALESQGCSLSLLILAMGGGRNPEREAHVRSLVALAQKYGVPCLPAKKVVNAARQKISELVAALADARLNAQDREALEQAKAGYEATFPPAEGNEGVAVSENEERPQPAPSPKAWKFQAVQLTYNRSDGEWASHDMSVLKELFDRFTSFVLSVAEALNASGTSTTMERGSLSPDHVHCHAYFHMTKPFHRRGRSALEIFQFEGICPHLEPNKASGKAYMGAVRYGHFYVMAPKIGSLFLELLTNGGSCGEGPG